MSRPSSPRETVARPSGNERAAAPTDRPALVLVADDDRVTRDLLAGVLRAAGYEVETVSDGQQAIERVSKGGVDLALLDAAMPRLSGLEACRVLKGMTELSFLPVILATVKTDPASRVEGVKVGADDYVCKPIEETELLARVSAALRIKRVYDEMQAARSRLERVSIHDELTNLFNYRYLHARLAEEFRRAEEHHEPLACCVVDVDRLRVHNDRRGRPFGDQVLRGVADVIRKSVRETDVVARYGGDEFLILLPATHFAGSLAVADRIRKDVVAKAWSEAGDPRGGTRDRARVTVSLGVALFPSRDVRAKDALLRAADSALHQAKRDGGGRLCVYQQHGFIYTPHEERGPSNRPPDRNGS
jgi:diguanylate cyclase (GGDEF)-like protein